MFAWLECKLTRTLAVVVLLVAGCGPAKPTAPAKPVLVYARATDGDFLDPIHTDMGESVKILVNVLETLVTYHEKTTEHVPGLATKWEVSPDGKQWTFHLRPNVKFHDGTDFDANAVVFSFRRLLGKPTETPTSGATVGPTKDEASTDPQDPAVQRPYAPSFKMIEDVTEVDRLTVRFVLSEPSAVFLENLCMFPASIVSPTAARRLGREFSRQPVGTGPFRFDSWVQGQTIELEAFPEYWGQRAGVEGVVFLSTPENAVRAEQLRRGTAHIADELPPTEIDGLAKSPQVTIQQQRGVNVAYLTMNMDKKPLGDVRVRRAIAHAIDKAKLAATAYSGKAEPAVNIVPRGMWGHNDSQVDRSVDLVEAKRLFEQGARRRE